MKDQLTVWHAPPYQLVKGQMYVAIPDGFVTEFPNVLIGRRLEDILPAESEVSNCVVFTAPENMTFKGIATLPVIPRSISPARPS
jgi:hypothetical protein